MTSHKEPPIIVDTTKMVNIAAPALSPVVIVLVKIDGWNLGPVLPVPALGLLVLLPPVDVVNGGVNAFSVCTSSISD
jgi:hypothetical protein